MVLSRLALTLFLLPFLGCSDDDGPVADRTGEVTGVVVAIDGEGFDEVESFTLRAAGADHEIWIEPGRDYAFPLNHLHAHLRGSEPVKVRYEEEDGRLVALTIEDA